MNVDSFISIKDGLITIISIQWGLLLLVLVATLIWIVYEITSGRTFANYMKQLGHTPPLRSLFPWNKRKRLLWEAARSVGSTWHIRRLQRCVIAASIAIFLLAMTRAFVTGHSLEIARAGAIIVLASLSSVVLGIIEARRIRAAWGKIGARLSETDKTAIVWLVDNDVDVAQYRAAKWAFYVGSVGTIFWAYGDQMLACGVFPLLVIFDKSSVVCI